MNPSKDTVLLDPGNWKETDKMEDTWKQMKGQIEPRPVVTV